MSPSPETFVPPRPRSHPNSAMGYQLTFLCCCRSGPTVSQRLIDLAGDPQPMQQNPQLPGYRHDGPLLGILALPGQLQSPALQIRVRSPVTENVMRSLHQHLPQVDVAFLADSQLWLALARL